jgi:AraC-like DNA-binding protein
MVRIGPLSYLPDLLRDLGVEPDQFLKQFGLTESMFANPDGTLPVETRERLLAASSRETDCSHFGLLLGQGGNASTLGAIGFLLRNAPDVHTALNELVANLNLHNRAAIPYLEIAGQNAIFGYETLRPNAEGAEQIYDGAMAIAWNIMRSLCGPGWLPTEVRLRRKKPDNVEVYQRFFQAPLLFDAEQTAVVFRASWLSQKVQLADPFLHNHFEQHVEAMRRYSSEDFVAQVKQVLFRLLGAKGCSLEEVSREFSIHPRTLNRRLKEAGTSFRELHNMVRLLLACQLLRDTQSDIRVIATQLGYSGVNAFTRAFSHWAGTPPAAWRKHILSGPDKELNRPRDSGEP